MEKAHKQKYFKKLTGELVYLSPINENDLEKYCEWLNDMEVTRNLTISTMNVSLTSEKGYLESVARKHSYAIITTTDDRLIGNCGLIDIDHINRNCEIGIFIGDKDYWGKGYGSEAMRLLLGYAFDFLNMRSVMLKVFTFNKRGIAAYRKLGFKEIGRRRKALIREGSEHDVLYMDLLDEEFRNPHIKG
jgi:RimJ/RimL family protein N-acetyltransferase